MKTLGLGFAHKNTTKPIEKIKIKNIFPNELSKYSTKFFYKGIDFRQ